MSGLDSQGPVQEILIASVNRGARPELDEHLEATLAQAALAEELDPDERRKAFEALEQFIRQGQDSRGR